MAASSFVKPTDAYIVIVHTRFSTIARLFSPSIKRAAAVRRSGRPAIGRYSWLSVWSAVIWASTERTTGSTKGLPSSDLYASNTAAHKCVSKTHIWQMWAAVTTVCNTPAPSPFPRQHRRSLIVCLYLAYSNLLKLTGTLNAGGVWKNCDSWCISGRSLLDRHMWSPFAQSV